MSIIINTGYYNSPIGILKIDDEDGHIVKIDFAQEIGEENVTEEINKCKSQLVEYFNGERSTFDVKTKYKEGTEFQKKVWDELKNIGYGETVTYKSLAEKIGNPKAVRAIGGANNKNKLMIILPCHRVIGTNGNLVGYAGGIDKKEYLLKLEKGINNKLL